MWSFIFFWKKKKSNCCLHYGNVFCDCGLQIRSDLDYKCRMLKWFCESCILVDVTFWAGSIQEKQKNRRYEHVGDGVGLVVVVSFHMSFHYVLVLVRVSNKHCLLAISCVHVCVFLLFFFMQSRDRSSSDFSEENEGLNLHKVNGSRWHFDVFSMEIKS